MNKRIISLTALLLCFLSISLTSCDGEDEGGDYVSPNYVAATWNLTAVGALNANSILVYTPVAEGSCEAQTLTLGEDSTFNRNYSIQFDDVCAPKADAGSYTVEQGNIVATYLPEGATESTVTTYDIITLSNVTLEIAYTDPVTSALVFLKFTKVIPVID